MVGGWDLWAERGGGGHLNKQSLAEESMPFCSAVRLSKELTDPLLQEDIKAMVPSAASLL